MNEPIIEPIIINGGSAFRGTSLNGTRPITQFRPDAPDINRLDKIKVVSLSEWCAKNFISKRVGRTLIKNKLLIGWRLYGQWWVTSNLSCKQELLEYLGVEELLFDVEQE